MEIFFEGSWKFCDKNCVIIGGDFGIGWVVVVVFVKEGVNVVIVYLKKEVGDVKEIVVFIKEQYGKKCLLVIVDFSWEQFCWKVV